MADQDRIMQLMQGQQGGATSAGAMPSPDTGGMSDATTPPASAPMTTPEPKMGNREGALINLSMAQDLIEQALPSIGSDSEEGRAALAAITAINKVLGPRKSKTKELQQSEILQMLQNLPQAGGGTPEGRAMAQAPAIPNMPPMPGAGGMPQAGGGAPSPQSLPM